VRTLLLTAIVSGCLVSFAGQAHAQSTSPGANASRFGIAVVDVSYIFKNYAQFKGAMEAMKGEMEAAESKLKSDRDAIAAQEEKRNQYNAGTPDYKQMDEEIARLKAEFNLTAGRIRNDFLEREAKVYYQTYLEVSNAVQYYGQQHNIGVVLRFNGDQIDPNLREDVLRAINKPVVYQNNVDITPEVLALLNRGGGPAGVAPTASGQQPTHR
jgi:Skp family chaperone for outer membrane proteins